MYKMSSENSADSLHSANSVLGCPHLQESQVVIIVVVRHRDRTSAWGPTHQDWPVTSWINFVAGFSLWIHMKCFSYSIMTYCTRINIGNMLLYETCMSLEPLVSEQQWLWICDSRRAYWDKDLRALRCAMTPSQYFLALFLLSTEQRDYSACPKVPFLKAN